MSDDVLANVDELLSELEVERRVDRLFANPAIDLDDVDAGDWLEDYWRPAPALELDLAITELRRELARILVDFAEAANRVLVAFAALPAHFRAVLLEHAKRDELDR
jgi:hypothetical protein